MEKADKIVLKKCCLCGLEFWVPKKSERKYCSKQCAEMGKSQKLKTAYQGYNPVIARSALTKESYAKQSASMVIRWKSRKHLGWFDALAHETQESIRNKLRAVNLHNASKPSIQTGSITKYGLRFDSKVELYVYEEFKKRNIYLERSVPYNGWLVDFRIPLLQRYLEVKSWYTVLSLQGVDDVRSKMDESIYLIEENDAYKIQQVPDNDIWSYLESKSYQFKERIVAI